MKKFFHEFKEFITRGNILDLAVGVIIGGAFNTIVTTLNKNILMPIVNWALSYLTNGSELCTVLPNYTLYNAEEHAGATPIVVNGVSYYSVNYINWSSFIESIINFFFIALTLFIIVKVVKYASLKRKAFEENLKKKMEEEAVAEVVAEVAEETEPTVTPEPVADPVVVLLQEIRDSLKQQKTADTNDEEKAD